MLALYNARSKCRKKSCNDDRNKSMMQPVQISQIVDSSSGLAGQCRVPEGVAVKPFFFTSSSRALCLFATVRLTERLHGVRDE